MIAGHDEVEAMRWAYQAALRSQDPSTQNGAIIIDAHGEVLDGWNAPTRGLTLAPDADRDARMLITEHAERAAIYAAARLGVELEAATMVCPWASCVDCARAIVCSGITTLYRHGDAMAHTPPRWVESITQADAILAAGGVKVIDLCGPIPGTDPIRHAGDLLCPWHGTRYGTLQGGRCHHPDHDDSDATLSPSVIHN